MPSGVSIIPKKSHNMTSLIPNLIAKKKHREFQKDANAGLRLIKKFWIED